MNLQRFRYYGLGLVMVAKLTDWAVSSWALATVPYIIEGNALAARIWDGYGWLGLLGASVAAIGLLWAVTALGARAIERWEDDLKVASGGKQVMYGIGLWLPGVWWVLISLNNFWKIYQYMQDPLAYAT